MSEKMPKEKVDTYVYHIYKFCFRPNSLSEQYFKAYALNRMNI